MADETTQAQQEPQEQPKEPTQAQEQTAIDYDKLASILDGRQKANEESVLKGYFKEQGLTGDEMAQAIDSFKAQRKAQQPDVPAMESRINELETKLRVQQVENAVTTEAVKMGIDPKVIPYLARMADLTDVGGEQVDPQKVSAALAKVLDDVPQLKPQPQEQQGFRVGGSGDKEGEQPKADDAALKRAFGIKD